MTQFTDKDTPSVTRPKTSGNSESIKVIVRCRPLSEVEIKEGHQSIISIDTNRGVIEIKNPKDSNETSKNFTFDAIYDWNSTQSELYDETFRDLVNSVLNGFNGTIFAYGQTGTGKTFTMEGNYNDKDLRGVIPNSFEHIFQHISNSTQQQYLVRASYLEIYQEEIRDLLNKDSTIRLELKERPDIGVYVKDLSSFVVKSVQEIHNVMSVGHANRSVGRTNMNEHSSRSHAIFMITIECSEVGPDGENHIRVGRLNLVDLAGSERQSKTGTLGERFKEATKINLSLSALGNVISALVDGKSSHIPYRDSKLTRLLQDSLGGNSKTIMVANIGPASYNYEETIGTLRYANRAKNIKNKPRINEDPKDALVREFQEEIARLKSMLEKRGLSSSRKRRNKKHNIMSDSTESNTTDQSNTLEYLEEQQRILENKQKEIYDSTSIISEEKQKLLEDLNIRKQELMKEREAQQNLADRIQAIQSKLLSGNSNLFDKTRKQENELESKRLEIAEQRKREREILQQLESQEFSTSEISQTFTTLKQEVELKTKKLKKLYLKYQQIRSELQDISFHHSRERQDLETSVSEITKELKLKLLIVDNFIPSDVVKKLKERAYFDDDADEWHILKSGHARPKTSDTLNESRLFNTSLNLEDEKASTFIHQDDTILSNKKNDYEISIGNFMQTLVLRPSSRPEQRRSFTIYEQQLLNKTRQRIQKSSCVKPTLFANEDNLVEEIIPEEVIRFCGENVITFSCLETFPSIVKNYDITSLSQSNKTTLLNTKKPSIENTVSSNCDVMIDVSRIPAPRRAISRDSRKEHKSNNKLHSSISIPKKEDARSVPYSLQHTTAMANISPNTNALVYPRARGLIPIPNKRSEEKNNNIDIENCTISSKNLSLTNGKHLNDNCTFYDSALSSLNDLTSLSNIDKCYEENKGNLKRPSIQSQSFNKLISSFTTPKQSKIPMLLSKSTSECHKSKREHFESVLVKSSYNNEIALGSCEQLTEIQLSPSIKAQNVLKACREKKVIPITKYSKPSLIIPLKRDLSYYQNNIIAKNCSINSYYFNEQSSGLGSSIITTQSLLDETEDKEVRDNVDKYLAFTKMRHSLKVYRNKMGGFDEEYYKRKYWLFLSPRGSCRICKHIPSFIINYGKIKKPNVVKRRPCICKKTQSISNMNNLSIYGNEFLVNFEISSLQNHFLLLLIPGVIALFIETFFSLISIF